MKRTRAATVAFYKNDFLSDKSPDYVAKFEEKDVNKQYVDIMNWKRKLKKQQILESGEPLYSVMNIYKLLKDANKEVEGLTNLSPKESEKALQLIEVLKDNIVNFDRIRKQHMLDDLLKQEEQLQKEGDNLRKKITDLQKELG